MNTSTHTMRRLTGAFTLAAIVACLAAATAQAAGPIDDWFRDPSVAAQTRPLVYAATDRLVDDWFRDAGLVVQPQPTPAALTRAAETFRQSEIAAAGAPEVRVASTSSGFGWSDFAVGIGSGIGLMLLFAAIAALTIRTRHAGRLRSP